jgi:hypothetical protein
MSSYNQVEETHTLAETLGLATAEILALYDEMADLCAAIAAQFPQTHEKIAKYRQAFHALTVLDEARTVLAEPLERIAPPDRNRPVIVKVGKQTRYHRPTSQRVRLGNAIVRLKGAEMALVEAGAGLDLVYDLCDLLPALVDVTFPERYG